MTIRHLLATGVICSVFGATISAQGEASRESPFILALPAENIPSLSYLEVYTTASLIVEAQLMEGLMRFDLGAGDRPVPNLALEYYVIDPLIYIFRLRSGIYFHPFPGGVRQEVTAEDVRFSLDLARGSKSPLASRLQDITSVSVVGTDLVQIRLRQPNPHLLAVLATSIAHVTSREYFMGLGHSQASRAAAFAKAPVGTGPYRLRNSLETGDRAVTLELFSDYRGPDGPPTTDSIKTIHFRLESDVRKITSGILKGTVDMASLPLTAYAEGSDFKGWGNRIVVLQPPFLLLLAINTRSPLLSSPEVRRVLNAAIQKVQIEKICPSKEQLKDLPLGLKRYMEIPLAYTKAKTDDQLETLLSDPATSAHIAHLRQAGPLRILISRHTDHIGRGIVESVAADLRSELGLRIEIDLSESISRGAIEAGNYEFAFVEWTPDTPWEKDDLTILGTLFSAKSELNLSGFEDEQIQQAFGEIRGLRDETAIQQQYSIVQERLLANAPLIWLPSVRHRTLFVSESYTAPFIDGSELQPRASSLVFYTSFMKDVRRKP